jgi:DNA-directed RNA polymerase subunit RPC12/RpoP
MTATTEPPAGGGPLEPGGGSSQPGGGSVPASGAGEGGATLIGAPTTSYLCANCSAELAVDQHYCVECGARRGKPRFTLAAAGAGETSPVAVVPAGGLALRAGALPARVTALLAVIAALLALGVGVLIGESGNTVKVSTVTVAGGSAGTTAKTPAKSSSGSGKTSTSTSGSTTSSGNLFGN